MKRAWLLAGGGVVLSAGLLGAGHAVRALLVLALGTIGAATLRLAGQPPRWPHLARTLGRRALAGADARLAALLSAADDALAALHHEGAPLAACLQPVGDGVRDLAQRALALDRLRAGHESTLAHIRWEAGAADLEHAARAALAGVNSELEKIRAVLATIGPSVRHLALITRAAEIDQAGEPPAELALRVATLRDALAEELGHAA